MKELIVLAALVMFIAVNVENAHASNTRKSGLTTVYDPAPMPLPTLDSDVRLPKII